PAKSESPAGANLPGAAWRDRRGRIRKPLAGFGRLASPGLPADAPAQALLGQGPGGMSSGPRPIRPSRTGLRPLFLTGPDRIVLMVLGFGCRSEGRRPP